jgi:methyl-accepting chemotaxis protein
MTQTRTTALGIETRTQQLAMWLSMLASMAEAGGRVQAAIEAQRLAVEHAVGAIEQIASNSRSVAATAQEILITAGQQDKLAADLAFSNGERESLLVGD